MVRAEPAPRRPAHSLHQARARRTPAAGAARLTLTLTLTRTLTQRRCSTARIRSSAFVTRRQRASAARRCRPQVDRLPPPAPRLAPPARPCPRRAAATCLVARSRAGCGVSHVRRVCDVRRAVRRAACVWRAACGVGVWRAACVTSALRCSRHAARAVDGVRVARGAARVSLGGARRLPRRRGAPPLTLPPTPLTAGP